MFERPMKTSICLHLWWSFRVSHRKTQFVTFVFNLGRNIFGIPGERASGERRKKILVHVIRISSLFFLRCGTNRPPTLSLSFFFHFFLSLSLGLFLSFLSLSLSLSLSISISLSLSHSLFFLCVSFPLFLILFRSFLYLSFLFGCKKSNTFFYYSSLFFLIPTFSHQGAFFALRYFLFYFFLSPFLTFEVNLCSSEKEKQFTFLLERFFFTSANIFFLSKLQ